MTEQHCFHPLLVEAMFVLVCLASLPGVPRRALDAAGLVLVLFWGVLQWQGGGSGNTSVQGMRATLAREACGMQRVL